MVTPVEGQLIRRLSDEERRVRAQFPDASDERITAIVEARRRARIGADRLSSEVENERRLRASGAQARVAAEAGARLQSPPDVRRPAGGNVPGPSIGDIPGLSSFDRRSERLREAGLTIRLNPFARQEGDPLFDFSLIDTIFNATVAGVAGVGRTITNPQNTAQRNRAAKELVKQFEIRSGREPTINEKARIAQDALTLAPGVAGGIRTALELAVPVSRAEKILQFVAGKGVAKVGQPALRAVAPVGRALAPVAREFVERAKNVLGSLTSEGHRVITKAVDDGVPVPDKILRNSNIWVAGEVDDVLVAANKQWGRSLEEFRTDAPLPATTGPRTLAGGRVAREVQDDAARVIQETAQPSALDDALTAATQAPGRTVIEGPAGRTVVEVGGIQIRPGMRVGRVRGQDVPPPVAGGMARSVIEPLPSFERTLKEAIQPNIIRSGTEALERAGREGTARTIRSLARNVPVIGNPSAVAKEVHELARVGHNAQLDLADRQIEITLAFRDSVGTARKLFGKTDAKTGRIVGGKFDGKALNEIAEFKGKFDLTPDEKNFIDRSLEIDQGLTDLLRTNGIDIPDTELLTDQSFASRIVMVKKLKGGEMIEAAFVGPSRAVGAKTGSEKARTFKTVAEGLREGFEYVPYDQALEIRARGVYKRIADKNMTDWVMDNLPQNVRIKRGKLGAAAQQLQKDADRSTASALRVLNVTLRATRGEIPPGSTIAAIRRDTPHIAAKLDAALAIRPADVERAVTELSASTLRAVRITREALKDALSFEARNVRTGEITQVPFIGQPISHGDISNAVGKLVRNQNDAAKVERELFRLAYRTDKVARGEALKAVIAESKDALVVARLYRKSVIAVLKPERARLRQAGFAEGRIGEPAFGGKIFTGDGAKEFTKNLNKTLTQDQEINGALRRMNALNAVPRMFALALDASPFNIQLIAAPVRHPIAFARSGEAFAEQLVRAFLSVDAASAHHARLLNDKADLLRQFPIVTSRSGTEFTETLGANGLLARRDGLFSPVTNLATHPFRAFQQAYQFTMDTAGVHMLEGLQTMAKTPKDIKAITDYVDNFRGLASSRKLGLTPNQRLMESALLLAPRYRRATLAMYANMLSGGVRGKLARQAFASLVAGLVMSYAGISIAMGVKNGNTREEIEQDLIDGLNPTHPRFLLFNIAGQMVGAGSKAVSDLRFISRMFADEDRFDFNDIGNPIFRWLRGQTSPLIGIGTDVLAGADFIGNKIERDLGEPLSLIKGVGEAVLRRVIPIWTQAVLFGGGPNDTTEGKITRGVADFFGLRSYPQGASEILRNNSRSIMGREYKDLEHSFERDILRKMLEPQLTPLQKEQSEQGRESALFFGRMAELDRIAEDQVQDAIDANVSTSDLIGIYFDASEEASTRKRENAHLLGIEFPESTTTNGLALDRFYDIIQQNKAENFGVTDRRTLNKALDTYMGGLKRTAPEVAQYIEANTNIGTEFWPPELRRAMNRRVRSFWSDIKASEKARADVLGKPVLEFMQERGFSQ